MTLNAIREGGRVQRAHTIPHHGSYSVAEHSFNALCILFSLYQKIEGELPSHNLIQAVMYHDIPERWTGDVPAPAKWYSPELKRELDRLEEKVLEKLGLSPIFNALTPHEKDWLKFVDLLELYTWTWDEANSGNNKLTADTARRVAVVLKEMKGDFPKHALDYMVRLTSSRYPELNEFL